MAVLKTPSRESARVAAELKVAVGRLMRRLRQAHEAGELTLSEMSVLSRLDREGPAAPGALADAEGVRPQAMATTLAALEQRGMVHRTPDPTDRRRVVMTLTDTGRAVIHDRRSATVRRLACALEEGFSTDERRELLAVVPLLERLAERL
jgi:DNA-binding MarR family transcriptional regulator